jgi:Sodium/calcium exchanger protein
MRNMISETFAGSTIIGAGLSLPVLLASYIAMFVSNADIGIGTVLGGNIFNQTINYAFSIYVAPNRRLKLCKVTLARETVLYLVSNFIIIWILDEDLHTSVQIINAKTGLVSCVLIAWPYSLALVLCFCVYCLIEAYFDGIVRVLVRCWRRGTVHISEAPTSSSPKLLSQDDIIENGAISMPSSCSHGFPSSIPSMNYLGDDECVRQSKSDGSSACHVSVAADDVDAFVDRKDSSVGLKATSEGDKEGGTKSTDAEPMVDNVSDFRLLVKDDTFAFFNFFDEVWQKRHCTLHADSCISFRTKKESERVGNHVTFVDLSHRSALCITSEINMEFAIKASYPLSRTFYCKALDVQTFNAVTRALAVMSLNSEDNTDPERLLAVSQSLYVTPSTAQI